jgi:4-oxalocrotonate tautomerase
MPIITVQMLEGRDKEKKKELIKNVTEIVVETLEVMPESVRVILQEMPVDNYGVAGLPVMEYRLSKH